MSRKNDGPRYTRSRGTGLWRFKRVGMCAHGSIDHKIDPAPRQANTSHLLAFTRVNAEVGVASAEHTGSAAHEPLKPRPLLIRPQARYHCFGDGLCCSDIHALGPVTSREAATLRSLSVQPVEKHRQLGILVVRYASNTPGSGCQFLEGQAIGGLCRVHAQHGELAKPSTCRRFPFGLTRTPSADRVTTDHRCPCRTMGERPLLTIDVARSAITDRAGRLVPDTHIDQKIELSETRKVSFASFETIESRLLETLAQHAATQGAASILENLARSEKALPPLDGATWIDIAHWLRAERDGTSGGEALLWFGDALLELAGGPSRPERSRPWSTAFDRAEARASTPNNPLELEADWVADELWSLHWAERSPFDIALSELTVRVAVARSLQAQLVSKSVRADRAMAEAICAAELVGATDLWAKVIRTICTRLTAPHPRHCVPPPLPTRSRSERRGAGQSDTRDGLAPLL
ncbi:MAG: YkgJ family cysteine cluster protein [Polyangiaceae bacterium]